MSEDQSAQLDLTLKLGHKAKTAIISKIIILVVLSVFFGVFFANEAARRAKKADTISLEQCSQAACIEEVSAYKSLLNADRERTNVAANIPIMFLAVLILFGFYELLAILIGLVVRKIVD